MIEENLIAFRCCLIVLNFYFSGNKRRREDDENEVRDISIEQDDEESSLQALTAKG